MCLKKIKSKAKTTMQKILIFDGEYVTYGKEVPEQMTQSHLLSFHYIKKGAVKNLTIKPLPHPTF